MRLETRPMEVRIDKVVRASKEPHCQEPHSQARNTSGRSLIMSEPILGIDVAKASLDVCLRRDTRQQRRQFPNPPDGFDQLHQWLHTHQAPTVHACLEATSNYAWEVALFLHQHGHQVSVLNPLQVRRHADAQLLRNKTDKLDAIQIADFCAKHSPELWHPLPQQLQELRQLLQHRDRLVQQRTAVSNQLEAINAAPSIASPTVLEMLHAQNTFLQTQIALLDKQMTEHIDTHSDLRQQQQWLESIPGIGTITAARLVAMDLPRFDSARSVGAYAGLTPSQYESGTSVHRRPQLSKLGNATLRKALYFPAITAMRVNPVLTDFAQRLRDRGKPSKVIITAVMRKLLGIAFGVLKSGKPFDPDYAKAFAPNHTSEVVST